MPTARFPMRYLPKGLTKKDRASQVKKVEESGNKDAL